MPICELAVVADRHLDVGDLEGGLRLADPLLDARRRLEVLLQLGRGEDRGGDRRRHPALGPHRHPRLAAPLVDQDAVLVADLDPPHQLALAQAPGRCRSGSRARRPRRCRGPSPRGRRGGRSAAPASRPPTGSRAAPGRSRAARASGRSASRTARCRAGRRARRPARRSADCATRRRVRRVSCRSKDSTGNRELLFPHSVGYHGRAPMREKFSFQALALVVAGVLLALFPVGCRQAPERAAGPDAASASGPRRGGTVVTGWTAEPGGVNSLILPSTQINNEMLFRMFLHLVEEQSDFQEHPATFKPQLAESYDWSPDHKTLTFHLRGDVVWTDGVPVTAEDVRWTWQAQRNPDVAWELADSKELDHRRRGGGPAHRPLPLLARLRQAVPRRQRGAGLPQARLGEAPLRPVAAERRLVPPAPGGGRPVHDRLLAAAAADRPAAQRRAITRRGSPTSTAW